MTGAAVSCVGAGPIGSSWAIVFARAGYIVRLYDREERAYGPALAYIERSLADLRNEGLITDERGIRVRIRIAASLAEAVRGAQLVVESIVEDGEVKRRFFSDLDRVISPGALATSSSSAIPGSEFMGHIEMKDRCLVVHPVNPPHLIPVVEFCATPWTSPSTLESCWALMEQAGQHPIRVNKEIPAFVVNRLQAAIIGEAMHLVDQGIVTVEDLDRAVKFGIGRRLAFTGPFESMHLNSSLSFEAYLDKYKKMLRGMVEATKVTSPWSDELLKKVSAERDRMLPPGDIPDRIAWRDRKLMKLAKIWAETEKKDDGTNSA